MTQRRATSPAEPATGICIKGEGVGDEIKRPGGFAEDNNGFQPCNGARDAAIRRTSQVVSNDDD
jgi:hypothetical protein